MRRRWLGLFASLAAIAACDGGTPVARGFGSRQIVSLRDPTFEFWAAKGDRVYYITGRDPTNQAMPVTYWSLDIGTGVLENLGASMPDLTDPQPPTHYTCEYATGADAQRTTYKITDTQTGELTVIEDVYVTLPYCPTDDDPTLQVWRIEADKTMTLWTGPYTYLVQAPLPFPVHEVFGRLPVAWVVSAPSPAPSGGLGVYALPDQDLSTATEILPAALDGAAWASGATPSGAPLASSGLIESSFFLPAGSGRYSYERAMADGSVVMFAGPQPSGPRELALFPVDRADTLRVLTVLPYDYRYNYNASYRFTDAWTSLEGSPTTAMFRLWRPDTGLFTACAWPGGDQFPNALSDPADENVLLVKQQTSYMLSDNSALMLVVPSASGGDRCKTMAPGDVGWADFSPDGTAMAWLAEPLASKATLWTAGRDGSAPRAIGTDYIDGFNYGTTRAPHFIGDSQLELTLAGDLVWVDVHDDPTHLHYITEQVSGGAIDLGRWLVTVHDYSDQDATGTLALINRDTGGARTISPAVAMYASPDVQSSTGAAGLFQDDGRLVRIVYLVRGRNPSAQDGLWVATISAQDRP